MVPTEVVPKWQVGSQVYVVRDGDRHLGELATIIKVSPYASGIRYEVRGDVNGFRWEGTYLEDALSVQAVVTLEVRVEPASHVDLRIKLSEDDRQLLMAVPEGDRKAWLDDYLDDNVEMFSFEIQEALWQDVQLVSITDSHIPASVVHEEQQVLPA